jgi:hypothetical protein
MPASSSGERSGSPPRARPARRARRLAGAGHRSRAALRPGPARRCRAVLEGDLCACAAPRSRIILNIRFGLDLAPCLRAFSRDFQPARCAVSVHVLAARACGAAHPVQAAAGARALGRLELARAAAGFVRRSRARVAAHGPAVRREARWARRARVRTRRTPEHARSADAVPHPPLRRAHLGRVPETRRSGGTTPRRGPDRRVPRPRSMGGAAPGFAISSTSCCAKLCSSPRSP